MPADPAQASAWRTDFGVRVRRLRLEKGLSQIALANEAGLHPTYLSSIERGERNVSLVNIHVLAAGLGVRPGDLFGGV